MNVAREWKSKRTMGRAARALVAGGIIGAVLAAGPVRAGEKTEKFWSDLHRKYPNESLVCLLDKVQLNLEYTGETVKRDATEMADFGADARTSQLALGSTFLTESRYEEVYAVFDQVAAARFQDWTVPLAAGETTVRTRIEVVDNKGKMVEIPAGAVSVRTAFPDAPELYSYVKELVFSVSDVPVPCAVRLYYTIQGENEYGQLSKVFAADQPTYRSEMVFNLPLELQEQFPFLGGGSLNRQRMDDSIVEDPAKVVTTPQGQIQQFGWKEKNLRARVHEPYEAAAVANSPRVSVAPNFESDWTRLLEWYAAGVDQALNRGGNDVVLEPVVREETEGLETEREEAEALYRYVQDRYDVLPIALGRDGYIPNRPVDVIELDEMSPCDLAALLVALYRTAGLQADMGITSSADRGQINQHIVALHQFDRPVVLLTVGDESFVIDPTNKTAPLGDPPAEIENNFVLRIRSGEPDWIPVDPSPPNENRFVATGTLELGEDGRYTVADTVQFLGEMNTLFRRRFYADGAAASDAARREWFGRNLPGGSVVSGFDQDRGESNADPFRIVFDVEPPAELVEDSGDTIVFSGRVFGHMVPAQYFDVDPAERKEAILLSFAESGSEQTSIRIPEGFEVDRKNLPETIDRTFDSGGYLLMYYELQNNVSEDLYDTTMVDDSLVIELSGDFILYDRLTFVMNYDLAPKGNRIPAENAQSLADFFQAFESNRDHRITMTRKVEEYVGQR